MMSGDYLINPRRMREGYGSSFVINPRRMREGYGTSFVIRSFVRSFVHSVHRATETIAQARVHDRAPGALAPPQH